MSRAGAALQIAPSAHGQIRPLPEFPMSDPTLGAAFRDRATPFVRPTPAQLSAWREARSAFGYAPPVHFTNGFNPPRPVPQAMRHGWSGRCPACGEGDLFGAFLDLHDHCPACSEALYPARVANATPLMAIPAALAAALLVGGALELFGGIALWAEILLCEAIGLAVALWVLPKAKGLLVGYAWACHLGGFDPLRHLLPDPEGGPEPEGGSLAMENSQTAP